MASSEYAARSSTSYAPALSRKNCGRGRSAFGHRCDRERSCRVRGLAPIVASGTIDRLIIRGLLVLGSDHAIAYCLGAFRGTPRRLRGVRKKRSELGRALIAAIRPV